VITLLATDAGVEVSASRAESASSAQGRPLSAGQPGASSPSYRAPEHESAHVLV
jgi:hypothetical protein